MAKRIVVVVLMGLLLSGCSNVREFFAEKLFGPKSGSSGLSAGDEGVYRSKMARAADTDQDSVSDGRDECANTPPGVMVDSYGCPVQLYLRVVMQYGRQTLEPDDQGMRDVDRIGRLLSKNPLTRAVISGHTDNQGNARNNLQLSRNRAELLKKMIVKQYHVPPERISAHGYGGARPMVSNSTEQGRRRNRRTEVTLRGYYRQEVRYVALGKPFDLHFATGQSAPAGVSEKKLAQLAQLLRENPQSLVAIEGHTDNVGNPKFNLLLSRRRAESVKKYLAATSKIDPARMRTQGWGEEKPIADNGTEAGRFQNRRVT